MPLERGKTLPRLADSNALPLVYGWAPYRAMTEWVSPSLLVGFLAVITLLYFPVASLQFGLLLHAILRRPKARARDREERNPGRKVAVVICTNGQNPKVVE